MYTYYSDQRLLLVDRWDRGYGMATFADERKLVMWLLGHMEAVDLAEIKDATIPQLLSKREKEV